LPRAGLRRPDKLPESLQITLDARCARATLLRCRRVLGPIWAWPRPAGSARSGARYRASTRRSAGGGNARFPQSRPLAFGRFLISAFTESDAGRAFLLATS
jgi:hypothetical protein